MRWYERLGGRKFTALLIGAILVEWVVVIWSYVIRDWTFAKFYTYPVLIGIFAYLGVNVWQKKVQNGGINGQGTEKP